ncbi:hypothetical protein SAMN03159339_2052 [Variovorax sp. 770b2]|nr:hypothetical protein SAMN03159339_2052 [Variovorax sp. 770b2]
MPRLCLTFIVVITSGFVFSHAGAQVALPLPAEIDAAGPESGTPGDKPAPLNARKAAEAKIDADHAAAMKKCDGGKSVDKPACLEQAESARVRSKAAIATELPAPSAPKK